MGDNYQILRNFYKKLLNLKLDFDDKKNEYCQFDLGQGLKIDFESQKAIETELPDINKKIKLLIRVQVDDADKAYNKIKKKNKTLSQPTDRPWGMRNFYLLDPVNNLVEVYQKI